MPPQAPDRVAENLRNRWPKTLGIGGRNASEYAIARIVFYVWKKDEDIQQVHARCGNALLSSARRENESAIQKLNRTCLTSTLLWG